MQASRSIISSSNHGEHLARNGSRKLGPVKSPSVPNTPDVEIVNHGSVVAFHLLSQNAKTFVDENVQAEGWQFWGDALCVDHRFAESLAEGMQEHGLVLA